MRASFVNYVQVDKLDCFTGTAEFREKEIKYDKRNHRWLYLNNRPVNFHTPSERDTPKEDTEQVEELLETTERTIVAAIQKLSLRRPSRPPTPQTGSVFGQTRPTAALLGSFPTIKGKERVPSTEIIAGPSFSAPNLSAPPI